ncbi:hypothetical protein Hanom_Chr14g01302841 [Helianthus anomalus]
MLKTSEIKRSAAWTLAVTVPAAGAGPSGLPSLTTTNFNHCHIPNRATIVLHLLLLSLWEASWVTGKTVGSSFFVTSQSVDVVRHHRSPVVSPSSFNIVISFHRHHSPQWRTQDFFPMGSSFFDTWIFYTQTIEFSGRSSFGSGRGDLLSLEPLKKDK